MLGEMKPNASSTAQRPVLPEASECGMCRGISSIIVCPNCHPHMYLMTEAQAARLRLLVRLHGLKSE